MFPAENGCFSSVFSRKIDWGSLRNTAKEWITNPMNMVLSVWILCVAVSGAILFLVMTGMLNRALPRKSQRDAWFEANNQILNALFTLICLYHHPRRLHHLVLVSRWQSEDVEKLRQSYCKGGTEKPHERAHMLLVVLLLNLNCFAQYALCGLNVGYERPDRPVVGVAVTISVAIAAPAAAGVYTVVSPLGKDYDTSSDEESQQRAKSFERKLSLSPRWSGGVLNFWEDLSSAYLSLFCSFCVFGWNMERLGFGNMYVHTATFLLVCSAPFWVLTLAAVHVGNEAAREALGTTGVFLCAFGLLYGGFWRIQMRKRFNLPPSGGRPDVADCASWLFCCWCSLAQEVRTGNAYDIVEGKFYEKPEDGSCTTPTTTAPPPPLERETPGFKYKSTSSSPSPSRFSMDHESSTRQLAVVGKVSSPQGKDSALEPPVPSFIRRDAR